MTLHIPTFARFADAFDGSILLPGQDGYQTAKEVNNATHSGLNPAIIVRPGSARGVAQAVQYAQEEFLTIAVRSGGHSPAGFGTIQGGLVIDLRGMKDIQINPETRRVRLAPGLTWGEVAAALHPHGLAITAGDVASVGVSGLTQGGGIGWFVRQHGLAVDRLRAVELVTAQGEIIQASATENPEIFWAVRGAGANLGVITALEFEAHAGGMIHGGLLAFEAGDPTEAARLMGEFARRAHEAPEALTMQGIFMAAPPAPFVPAHLVGKTIFAVLAVYSGAPELAELAYAGVRTLGTPAVDLIGPMPYPAMFEFTKEASMTGFRHLTRSGFLNALSGEALAELGRAVQVMQPGQMVQLRPLGGALARVADDDTAFSHRQAKFLLLVGQMLPVDLPAEVSELAWAAVERLWAPFAGQRSGLYSNFATERDVHPERAAFHTRTRERLARLKAQLDPQNVFARNVNIAPAVRELVSA